jgi:hypothetical protein
MKKENEPGDELVEEEEIAESDHDRPSSDPEVIMWALEQLAKYPGVPRNLRAP